MEVNEAPICEREDSISSTEEARRDIILVDLSWLPDFFNLLELSDDYVVGFVKSQEDAEKLLKLHSWNTVSSFLNGRDDFKKRNRRHLTKRVFINSMCSNCADNNYMYTVENVTTYLCQFGGSYRPRNKTNEPKAGTRTGTTKHVNCPAKVIFRYITMYLDYPMDEFTRHEKRKLAVALKKRLDSNEAGLRKQLFIHVSLPLKNAHENHIVSKRTMYMNKTHPSVLQKIEELVSLGMHTIKTIKPLLYNYSKTILCPELGMEPDLKFEYLFPNSKSIGNQLNRSKRKFDIPRKKINPKGFSVRYQRRMAKKGISIANTKKSNEEFVI